MRGIRPASIGSRLTVWYAGVLALLLLVYGVIVFAFQYATLTNQIFHDEVQDVVTVEGLLYFDSQGVLQLRQDYYSRPQSHLLVDRMMEVRDLQGNTLYRSTTLRGLPLGGPNQGGEGDAGFDQRILRLSDGRHVFVISHLHGMGNRTLLIRLGYSLVPLRDRMFHFFLVLLVAFAVVLAIAAVAGQLIAKRALQPLGLMAEKAANITAHNLSDRLVLSNPDDELGQMGATFNRLLERLEQSFQQLQRFTADAAHELRTPLASLRAVGEVALQNDRAPDGYRDALSSILEETSRLNETIDSLLLLARAEAAPGTERLETFAIREPIDEILNLLGVLIEDRRITVHEQGSEYSSALVTADRQLLRVALLNVLHNALKFSPNFSALTVSYRLLTTEPGSIEIAVTDEGPGVAPKERELVFDRFYKGHEQPRGDVSGAGLGLAVSRLVVERSGGGIYFDEKISSGARCVVQIPLARD